VSEQTHKTQKGRPRAANYTTFNETAPDRAQPFDLPDELELQPDHVTIVGITRKRIDPAAITIVMGEFQTDSRPAIRKVGRTD